MNNPNTYKVEITQKEESVTTCVDDWDEVRIHHPLYSASFLYSMIFMLEELSFVNSIYIASNGLLRLNIKGYKATVWEDISIHPSEGVLLIMRNYKDEYTPLEDEIIDAIKDYTIKITDKMQDVDNIFNILSNEYEESKEGQK